MAEFMLLNLVPMLTGIFAAVGCTLIGNFLLLRRQSLLGDAISHVVLPGIVAAFLITGAITESAMLLGAVAAAMLAALLFTLVERTARVEPGAAMGAVFTAMFAGGVLMLEQSGASSVHLDVEHALYGSLESLIWLEGANGVAALFDWNALAGLPHELPLLMAVCLAAAVCIAVFFKELRIATFDPDFGTSIGLPVRLTGLLITLGGAVMAVSAFTAVGSILVIAMYIAPAAAARLLTDNLRNQLVLSTAIAALCGFLGYGLAAFGPVWLGYTSSVSAGGMIAAVSGLAVVIAALIAKRDTRVRSAA